MTEMTAKKVHAIEQVLLFNADLCLGYERRGVTRDDLREVFRIAERAVNVHARVLKEWQRLAAWPGVQIRTKAGSFGEITRLAENKRDLVVRLDGGPSTEVLRDEVFPIWWPEEEWAK